MNTVRISFPNAQGELLAARLELPDLGQPLAYALFAHCFTCSKDLTAAVQITRALSGRGIAVLRFDFTGLGESEGDFSATTFSSEVSDLVAAARFLEQHYQAPQLLIGHSLGGTAVLAAVHRIPSTLAVATIAAPFKPSHLRQLLGASADEIERNGQATVQLGRRSFLIRKSLLDDLDAQGADSSSLHQIQAGVLVMHSPRDKVVGIDHATRIYRSLRHPKSFISLDPADHLLSQTRDSRYVGEMIAAWADRYLLPEQVPTASAQESGALDHQQVVTYTASGGFVTRVIANGFSLLADEPTSYGGSNQGPTPYGYLMTALGACTGMTVQMYARLKGWLLTEAVVRLSYHQIHAEDCQECEEQDRRIHVMERELELVGELDQAQRQRLLEMAEHCPVHRVLTGRTRIKTTLKTTGESPADESSGEARK